MSATTRLAIFLPKQTLGGHGNDLLRQPTCYFEKCNDFLQTFHANLPFSFKSFSANLYIVVSRTSIFIVSSLLQDHILRPKCAAIRAVENRNDVSLCEAKQLGSWMFYILCSAAYYNCVWVSYKIYWSCMKRWWWLLYQNSKQIFGSLTLVGILQVKVCEMFYTNESFAEHFHTFWYNLYNFKSVDPPIFLSIFLCMNSVCTLLK